MRARLFWRLPYRMRAWVLFDSPGWLLCWWLADAWAKDEFPQPKAPAAVRP